jgi:hypothetical protein
VSSMIVMTMPSAYPFLTIITAASTISASPFAVNRGYWRRNSPRGRREVA